MIEDIDICLQLCLIKINVMSDIYIEIQKRILVLDGAMGTMLQQYNFKLRINSKT